MVGEMGLELSYDKQLKGKKWFEDKWEYKIIS